MLHVLTITPFYPIEQDDAQGCFVAESLGALQKLGVKNTIIAARPFYRGRVKVHATAPAASWHLYFTFPGGSGLPTGGVFLFSALLSQIRRLHRKEPIDLIHAHAALPCGHAAALLARELKIPFIVTVHGLDAYFIRQVPGYAGRWCKRISQWVYRSAAKTICISEKVRDQVSQEMVENATVIYNGVDPDLFYPQGKEQNYILSVGNLIPIKDHELLLRGIAAIRERFPHLTCIIIGDGPNRIHLQTLANELKIAERVVFRGRQSRKQVAAAMAQCTLFALPSRYEGLGCVYLEAMSAEKPVIACTGQGIDEVLQHGYDGWLITPGDLSAMTDSLIQLLENPEMRRRIGQQGRCTILSGFTLAKQAEMLLRLYRGCLA